MLLHVFSQKTVQFCGYKWQIRFYLHHFFQDPGLCGKRRCRQQDENAYPACQVIFPKKGLLHHPGAAGETQQRKTPIPFWPHPKPDTQT
eukprot:6491643-Amphidinium_carterae.1